MLPALMTRPTRQIQGFTPPSVSILFTKYTLLCRETFGWIWSNKTVTNTNYSLLPSLCWNSLVLLPRRQCED